MKHDTDSSGIGNTLWEEVACTRWGSYVTGIEERAILKAHALSGAPARAIEIGVEGGRWSRLLSDRGWAMTCTDVDGEVLAICKKRIPSADCILVDPSDCKLPCESESMKLLLCIEVPYVMNQDWFVEESTRVLQNGGIVVGVFLNRLSLRGLYVHARRFFAGIFDDYKLFYPSWRKQLLRKGYTMLYEEGYCWFPFGRSSNSPLVPFFVHIEKWLGLRRIIRFSPWIVFIARKTGAGN